MNPFLYFYAGLNSIFFPLRSRIGWKGRNYHEKPVKCLPPISHEQQDKIQYLQEKYGVHFEASLNARNTLRNYYTLDLLDQAARQLHFLPREELRLVDVGSKNFYYAAALHAFFKPQSFVGIELDGFHLYRGFYTNASYASFYAAQLRDTTYRVMNFKDYHEPVHGVVWFFPFVLQEDAVTWYLPLSQFDPLALFKHAYTILMPGGFLFMVNTDEVEYTHASAFLNQVGFLHQGMEIHQDGLFPKVITPYVSFWSRP